MARHLVVFRSRVRFLILFFCSSDVIGQETCTGAFKKISRAPWSSGNTNVKAVFFPAFQPRDEFLGLAHEAESAREVIGGAKRKNAQRNAAINQSAGDLCDGAVTSGNQHEMTGLFERFLVTAFFSGLINR